MDAVAPVLRWKDFCFLLVDKWKTEAADWSVLDLKSSAFDFQESWSKDLINRLLE
jgi:hypothetical protein